jgi:thiol:disulfide interchange protein DsbA
MIRSAALLVALLLPFATPAQSLLDRYQAGVHYLPIEPAQPTPANRIEVVEVFNYACVHCNEFQPQVRAWKAKLPADVVLRYLPASFSQVFAAYAAAYYAAQELGVAEKAHEAMYERLWTRREQFTSMQDIAAFYAGYGTTAEAFMAAIESPAVRGLLERGQAETMGFQVDGTPTIVVAGKYRVTGASAGGYDKVFEVVDFLVARERSRRAAPRA